VQTFSKIRLNNIEFGNFEVKIKIPDLLKTSKPGTSQPTLILPFFNERPEICPVKTLQVYLDLTHNYRNQNDTLFLSCNKPHKAVGSQTLSRWVKDILKLSGIDTSRFTAHSTRHAATSAAQKLGVNIDQIRKAAGWSPSTHTFAKFYNRPIINESNCSLGRTILLESMNKPK
jgi:integrase